MVGLLILSSHRHMMALECRQRLARGLLMGGMPCDAPPPYQPVDPVGIGAVPGLDDVMLVLEARRWRRGIRFAMRLVAGVAAVVVVAVVASPAVILKHVESRCEARFSATWAAMLALSEGASGPPSVLPQGDGYRFVVTDRRMDFDETPPRQRYLVWAFSDVEGDHSAIVTNERAETTSVLRGCSL
jgi:hypothetical protein